MLAGVAPACAVRCHSSSPLSRSRQNTIQRWVPGGGSGGVSEPVAGRYRPGFGASYASSATTDVRNTLLPQTIGLDHPTPGIGVFQATPSVALHVSGSSGMSSTTAVMSGPRHCGQLSDAADTSTDGSKARTGAVRSTLRMRRLMFPPASTLTRGVRLNQRINY